MPATFGPTSDLAIKCAFVMLMGGMGLGVFLAFALLRSSYATETGQAVEQPIPFSHQHHVGQLGIDCRYCHRDAEQSSFAGMPSTETCMSCHAHLWSRSAMLAPVRQSLAEGRPLRWRRVHDLPDHVYFNHSIHVNKGIGCATCHGRVDRMAQMAKAQPLFMSWCVDCHRDPAPYLRPHDRIYDMSWQPGMNAEAAAQRMGDYGIDVSGLADCSRCHR